MPKALIDRLTEHHSLSLEEYQFLVERCAPELSAYAAEKARSVRIRYYGKEVYIRGLIELSNYCKNNCRYCGIRRENEACHRYRLTPETVLSCCETGYALGFRTFVLQGGEDPYFTDRRLCSLLTDIKSRFPDCAVTLSLGERPEESYQALRKAGADRYLLRHETADRLHYELLHPSEMSFSRRMECLSALKRLGFHVGCGFMVGSPGQSSAAVAKDLKFIECFQPAMCGIGPFIPHQDTPFAHVPAGSLELTLFLLSLIRLILPNVLLPATTALATLAPDGRQRGILAGANVVMPNLSPKDARKSYTLYDKKAFTDAEAAEGKMLLEQQMNAIGYRVVTDRGDPAPRNFGKEGNTYGNL